MFIFVIMRDTKMDYKDLVKKFVSNGGSITKCEPSKIRFKTFRGKAGAYNRGAKKINLQDRGVA